MAFTPPSNEDDEPLDPVLERVQARLRRLMLIAGLTLGVGIFAVFGAILYRIVTLDTSATAVEPMPAGAAIPTLNRADIGVANDAELVSAGIDGGEIVLTYRHARGETLVFVDRTSLAVTRVLEIASGSQ